MFIKKNNTLKQLITSAAMLLIYAPCFCSEGGLGAYPPGFRSFLTGIVPPIPGYYLRDDTIFYSGDAPRVVLNGRPVENISADIALNIIEPTYVFPWKLWNANYAVVLTLPLIWADLSGRIIGTDIEPSDDRFDLGDLIITPIYLGWHEEKVHYNANLTVFIPTASYDVNRVVNTGRNHWTFDPQFGITYLDPETGWELSTALGYSINTENHDTNYKSGQVLHLDYAVGRTLKNGIKPGIVGYAWIQTTSDTGSGALFGSFKSCVYGIGPGVQWRTGEKSLVVFRYYHEFGAKNHLEGDQVSLSFRMRF